MIKFDSENRVQDYTLVLSRRNHNHLGQLRNVSEVISKINMNAANEISFTVHKYDNGISEKLWDEITDFKYIYVKELDEYYEIIVDNNDDDDQYKSITGTSACEAELSQSKLYGLEINTEADIARKDYVNPTIFYDSLHPECSLLNRVLYKLPQYSIKHVDASLMAIQRTFSADDEDVYSFLVETVAEEIGCLFTFDSTDRSISVYDLKTVCVDCGERGEFSDVCPKCGSTNLKYYGEDTTVYVDTENLAESINFKTNTESIKNCFKLQAGDDNMTAAVINLNPNGSSYIYYFSEEQKHDMTPELVEKLESYDELVASYEQEYEEVMGNMYEAIDKIVYYTSGMMPTQKDDPTNATLEAAKLTEENMSPMGLPAVTTATSLATVNSALKNYAKVYVKSGYFKIEVNESEFEYVGQDEFENNYGYWYGNFKVTNYSDEEDVAISSAIRIKVYDLYQTFLEQKIEKKLANDSEEEGSIYDVLSIKDLTKFKEALTYYGLNRLTSFYDAIQGCLDIMIEEDQANENADLYESMYVPYHDKLLACQDEIDKRKITIDEWGLKLDIAEERQKEIQKNLDFESFLGEELYLEFCCYKREDTFSNDNYISDGLENDEIFERAREFLNAAKEELVKSGEHQHQISSTLYNLLGMEEFEPIKDKFQVGNFIRVGIDDKVYRLRLTSYQITFEDFQNIDVEFSDVTRLKNGVSDLQSVLSKASSMASSYDSTIHQVEKSKKQTDRLKNWVDLGLDATSVKIVNNADNQNITIGETGLLARRKDEFTEKYEPYQVKLLSTGLYTTSDSFRTVDTAIGKSYYINPTTGKQEVMFGVQANALVGKIILGSSLGIYSQDQSAEMTFDNFGLVLNAKDNGTGQYKRILDIQKDGISQLYIDNDGNIVLATNQMIETVESIDRLNALYADIENLYVSNATIEKLLAKYATVENLEAVNAKIENLDVSQLKADFGEFKELVATQAEIDDLKAGKVTIAGKLSAQDAEIENVKATYVKVGSLEAYKGTIENLFATNAEIEKLKVQYAEMLKVEIDEAKIKELEALIANIDTLNAKIANVETLVSQSIITGDLDATKATIDDLDAKLASIDKAIIEIAKIEDLTAVNAEIDKLHTNEITAIEADITNLKAQSAEIQQLKAYVLQSEYGEFKNLTTENLKATNADIGTLNANYANITSILSGNIGTGLLQTVHLTAENVIIDDAVIKSAMIESIDTDLVTVGNNNIILAGSTQQFKDKNGKVRVQIGQDAQGDFNFLVVGEDGTTAIMNENGIQSAGIPNGIIVDDMVSDIAGIQAKKIKFIDKDGDKTLQTVIEAEQGQISALIKETTIINDDGTSISLKDKYLDLDASVEGIKTTILDVSTDLENMNTKITDINLKADGIYASVSSIGGQNLFYYASKEWLLKNDTDTLMFVGCYKESTDNDMEGRDVTLSIEIMTDTTTSGTFDICYFGDDSSQLVVLKSGIELTEIEEGRYVYTFEYPTTASLTERTDGTYPMFTMVIRNTNISGYFAIRKGMIQYGRLATEWQPTSDNLSESMAKVEVQSDKINWIVKSGNDETDFEMTPRAMNLTAEYININGKVTFGGLDKDTQNKINNGLTSGIGGRNLIYNTNFNKDQTDNWQTFNDVMIEMTEDGYMKVIHPTVQGGTYAKYGRGFKKDNEYTLSFIAYADTECVLGYNYIMSSEGNKSLGVNVNLTTTPTKYIIHFTPTEDYPENSTIMIGLSGIANGGTFYFKEMMVELGSTASEYQQAPEDVSDLIDDWTSEEVPEGTTVINGGTIKAHSIKTDQIDAYDIFSDGTAVMNMINAQGINADRINAGKVVADYIDWYGARVLQKGTDVETLSISDDGSITMRGNLESYNYHAGKTGFLIKNTGDVEFNDVLVRGSVVTNDGGIVSSGGSGTNLLLNSSMSNDLTNWSYSGWSITTIDGYKCAKVSGELTKSKNLVQSVLSRIKNDAVTQYTISAWVKMVDYVAGETNPFVALYFSGTYDNAGTSTWIGSTTVSGDSKISNKSGNGWVKLVWTVSFAQVLTSCNFTVYARDFTGDVYVRDLKIEEGNVATEWSSAPQDKTKQIRFWAGSTYEQRDNAPFKVWNDGTIDAIKGNFQGTVSGNIEIGNISISDPSSTSGDDALLNIKNGENGINAVQLRDTDLSSFAQNIEITDHFYNRKIILDMNGYGIFDGGINVDKTQISSNNISLNNYDLTTNDNGYVFKSNVDIGTSGDVKDINVYGDINANNIVKVKKAINFNDNVICTISEFGIDFNFIN